MIHNIDNFIEWVKDAKYIKDLVIRLIVVAIVLGIGGLLWFISIPIICWYLYKKFGNKPLKSCECSKCHKKNSINDNFCIYCGNDLNNKSFKKEICSCHNCGKNVNCNDKYCEHCGKPLADKNSDDYDMLKHSIDGIFVALLSKIAKVDGRICEEEATYISNLLTTLSNHRKDIPNVRDIYKQIMNDEKDDLSNINSLCDELRTFDIEERDKIDLIRMMVELAFIDSEYDKTEEDIIVKIVHKLDIEFSIYQNIKNQFEPQSHSNNKSNKRTYDGSRLGLSESYEILESKDEDSDKTIKNNYRRLVKQYHYDSIISKDLPKDIIEFAEEKLKMINAAYDVVKKYRGM